MRIKLSDDAERDLAAGYAFYEGQSEGVGVYFLDSIFAEIDSLLIYAGIHRVVHGSHRMLAERFPFAIYYDVSDTTVWIWAILDCRSDPRRIQAVVRKRRSKRSKGGGR